MPNVPHVVAVVVVHNPGTWFQETIDSLRNSDYPNFSTIFVDTSTDIDVESVIRESMPEANVVKGSNDLGFAAACNLGTKHSGDASHLLFCHDDVAFAPDAIRKMVEEAFLMNAGIVTPKYVVWNSPQQILALGGDLDRTGTLASRIDVGDLDQEQYDFSQEVFVAPGGATLVRKDLFEAVHGFDDQMFQYYEDIDLSWRAQLAGARIVAAPLARVRHLSVSTLGARRARGGRRRASESIRTRLPRHDRLRYARRNQLRALLVNSNGVSRFFSILQYVLISLAELIYFLITGKPKIALAIFGSWTTVLSDRASRKKKRKSIFHYRVRSDKELRKQMIRGSARVRGFSNARKSYKSQGESARKVSGWRDSSAERTFIERLTTPIEKQSRVGSRFDDQSPLSVGFGRISRVFMWLIIVVVLIGTRHLTTGSVPLYGQFLPFGSSHNLLSIYFSGPIHQHGFIPPSATADLLLGALGTIFLGGVGVAAHFTYAGLILLGIAGTFRLVSNFRNRTAAYVGASMYAIGPILVGVVTTASLSGLVIFGMAPWLVERMLRLADVPGVPRSSSLSRRFEMTVEGIWLALIVAFAPSFLLVFALLAITLAISGSSLGYLGSLRKFIIAHFGALFIALFLNAPWIISFFIPGAHASAFFGAIPPAHIGLLSLLIFKVAPNVKPSDLFGLYLVAFVATFLFAKQRIADRVVTLMALFAVVFLLAVFSSYGALGQNPIPLAVVLPVAFLMTVVIIGSGVEAAFNVLPNLRVGWKHLVLAATVFSIVIATFSMIGGNISGRYQLVSQGYEYSLGWMVPNSHKNPGKALWLGRPGTLPIGSYQISSDIAAAITEIGSPKISSVIPAANPGRESSIFSAINQASREDTVYLGKALAQARIKYVVIPQSSLSNYSFLTSDLNLMLSRQRDLNQLVADPSVVAFSVQDPLKPPSSHTYGGTAAVWNLFRYLFAIVVSLSWLALLEATVNRRSLTVWLFRRFQMTRIGEFTTRASSRIARANDTGMDERRSPHLHSPRNRIDQVSDRNEIEFPEFKHVKVTHVSASEVMAEELVIESQVVNVEE